MKRLNLMKFLILLTCFTILNADEYYDYMEMKCDPSTSSVSIENVDQWNERPSEDDYTFKQKVFSKNDLKPEIFSIYKDGECVFANGNKIRLRLGSDGGRPYGQCGAAPALWFSLWVNEKKVLSKSIYNPTCNPGSIIQSISVTDKNITFNKYKIPDKFLLSSEDINTSIVQTKIVSINNNLLIDRIEYPKNGKKVPAGTKMLLHGDKVPVCKAFIEKNWHKKVEQKTYVNGCSYSANSLSSYMIDIDNDGIKEREFVDSRWGRFEYTDIYLLDENNTRMVDELLEQLPKTTGYDRKIRKQCENIVEVIKKGNNPSIPKSWANGDNLILPSINKTLSLPHRIRTVEFQGKSYFEFFSDGIYGLLEYKSNTDFQEVCLAKEVKENY